MGGHHRVHSPGCQTQSPGMPHHPLQSFHLQQGPVPVPIEGFMKPFMGSTDCLVQWTSCHSSQNAQTDSGISLHPTYPICTGAHSSCTVHHQCPTAELPVPDMPSGTTSVGLSPTPPLGLHHQHHVPSQGQWAMPPLPGLATSLTRGKEHTVCPYAWPYERTHAQC